MPGFESRWITAIKANIGVNLLVILLTRSESRLTVDVSYVRIPRSKKGSNVPAEMLNAVSGRGDIFDFSWEISRAKGSLVAFAQKGGPKTRD